jgi:hypothetical protein
MSDNLLEIFLASGAGAFIGGMIGAWVVTRWLFNRIRELEYHIETMQDVLLKLLHERKLKGHT